MRDRYVTYATKPSSPASTWDRDDDDNAPSNPTTTPTVPPVIPPTTTGDRNNRTDDYKHNSGSGKDQDRNRDDHDDSDCRRTSGGQWRCSGRNGHSEGWDRNDALRKYLRLRPIIYPVYPVVRPIIRRGGGNKQDVDIDVKNIYNIEQPDLQPPPVAAPEPEMSGGFSFDNLPSWAIPAGALGLVLILVLVLKK